MATMVSAVFVPMCGRMTHLGCVRRGWPTGSGSGSVTSNPAAAIVPSLNASAKSSWFTTTPLDVLIRIDVLFILCNSLLFTIPLVSELTPQQMHSISEELKRVSNETYWAQFSAYSISSKSLYRMRSTPKGFILRAIPNPTRPNPRIPIVLLIRPEPHSQNGFQQWNKFWRMASIPVDKW